MPLPGMLQKRSLNDLEVNMPSLLDAAEAFSKLGKKSVEIDQAACVRVRHRHASCMACFQVCAHEAIARDNDGLLVIDNHLCTGCGACASVCPTSALQLVEDVPELVQAAIESIAEQTVALQNDMDPSSAGGLHTERPCGTLTISCEYLRNQEAARSTEPADRAEAGDALVVPCLAALDESTIIATSCAGVELRYRSADCAICPNAQGSLIAEVSEQAEHLLAALVDASPYGLSLPGNARAIAPQWTIVEAESEEASRANTSPELSRRGMFGSLRSPHDRFDRRSSGRNILRGCRNTARKARACTESARPQGLDEAR